MDDRLNEIFDVVMIIIVLAVAFSSGYTAIMAVNKEMRNYQSPYEDKNTSPKNSDFSVYHERDAVLTKGEVLLMTTVQDEGLKGPDTFTYDGRVNTVTMPFGVAIEPSVYTNLRTTGRVFVVRTVEKQITDPQTGQPTTIREKESSQPIQGNMSLALLPGDSITIYGDVTNAAGEVVASGMTSARVTTAGTITSSETAGSKDVNMQMAKRESREEVMQSVWNVIRADSASTGYSVDYKYEISKFVSGVGTGERFRFYGAGTIRNDGTVN